jgi:hypothetical protein
LERDIAGLSGVRSGVERFSVRTSSREKRPLTSIESDVTGERSAHLHARRESGATFLSSD